MTQRMRAIVAAFVTALPVAAWAQVPASAPEPEPLRLTLSDAVQRGLNHNLNLTLLEQQVEGARGARLRSLKELLPKVEARAGDVRQTANLAAFGFDASLFPGVPAIVGPFNVFDARVTASQAIVDLAALNESRRTAHAVAASELDSNNARDVVTQVVTQLYLQAVADTSRIAAVREQVTTSEALLKLATDMKNAGAAPGIDVVRAQVQVREERQRLIVAESDLARRCIQIARAIGLGVGRPLEIVDQRVTVPMPELSLETAVRQARTSRADYRAAVERASAAEAGLQAARAERLPSVHVNADYGVIGSNPSDALRTYSMSAGVRVPVFDAGRRGKVAETTATLKQRQAEAADAVERVEAEVRTAFLDVRSAEQQLAVANERVALANQELGLARTRFTAGVAGNLEVIQAQTAVETAVEAEIGSTYAFNSAKAALTRAIGGGTRP